MAPSGIKSKIYLASLVGTAAFIIGPPIDDARALDAATAAACINGSTPDGQPCVLPTDQPRAQGCQRGSCKSTRAKSSVRKVPNVLSGRAISGGGGHHHRHSGRSHHRRRH